MGSWSEDTFGNDTACDWIGSFLDDPSLAALENTISAVLETDGYLDSDFACECLAACEVIARLQGKPGVEDAYSEDLDAWIRKNPLSIPDVLRQAADQAIERILGPDSELVELWDDGEVNEEWHRIVNDLRNRVNG